MIDKPDEIVKLPMAEASLYRNAKWMDGTREVATGDRMVVQHFTGSQDNVVILKEAGQLKAKRLVDHMEIVQGLQSSSTRFSQSFADLDDEDEKEMLAIYSRFQKQS